MKVQDIIIIISVIAVVIIFISIMTNENVQYNKTNTKDTNQKVTRSVVSTKNKDISSYKYLASFNNIYVSDDESKVYIIIANNVETFLYPARNIFKTDFSSFPNRGNKINMIATDGELLFLYQDKDVNNMYTIYTLHDISYNLYNIPTFKFIFSSFNFDIKYTFTLSGRVYFVNESLMSISFSFDELKTNEINDPTIWNNPININLPVYTTLIGLTFNTQEYLIAFNQNTFTSYTFPNTIKNSNLSINKYFPLHVHNS